MLWTAVVRPTWRILMAVDERGMKFEDHQCCQIPGYIQVGILLIHKTVSFHISTFSSAINSSRPNDIIANFAATAHSPPSDSPHVLHSTNSPSFAHEFPWTVRRHIPYIPGPAYRS